MDKVFILHLESNQIAEGKDPDWIEVNNKRFEFSFDPKEESNKIQIRKTSKETLEEIGEKLRKVFKSELTLYYSNNKLVIKGENLSVLEYLTDSDSYWEKCRII